MNIFNRLLEPDGVSGADALASITVTAGEEKPEDPAPAALEGFDDPSPDLILTDDALYL